MEIKKTFNTTKKEIESKKFNIIVPICLGNKFFVDGTSLTENLKEYIHFALKYTKNKLLILIADKIQLTNYLIRNKRNSLQYNLRRVLREGNQIKLNLKKYIKTLPVGEQDKIEIIQWEEYDKSNPLYNKITKVLYNKFKEDKEFRNEIIDIVKTSVVDKGFSEEEYIKLCNYVLDEFCVCYSGAEYRKLYFGLIIYPFSDSVLKFIINVQNNKIFSELNKKLPKEKVTWAIVN